MNLRSERLGKCLRWSGVGAGLALALSGCTVPVGGTTAVGVDEDGSPIAYVVMCEGHVDSLILYFDEGERAIDAARMSAERPVTANAEVGLADPGPGWTVDMPLGELSDGREYSLFGGSNDNSWSSAHVSFTTQLLARLEPGQVVQQRYDESIDDEVDVISSAKRKGNARIRG